MSECFQKATITIINNFVMKLFKLAFLMVALGCAVAMSAQSEYKSQLPVKPGKGVTVAGTVECDGKPVAGVTVSDGYEVTKTDKKGAYYLKSKKQNPQVFMTIPSGYEAVREDVMPQFWADFMLPADQYERHDFRLKKVDNKNHAVIFLADIHLANERNDVDIFSGPYVDKIKEEVKTLNAAGIPVYTINLGDGSWDLYWYAHEFAIGDLRTALNDAGYPTAFYNVMGNHDNNGATPSGEGVDYRASLPYQKAFGPRYYSQNIGDVHYVFLDNIEYLNEPLKSPSYPGITGRRNYHENFTQEQLDWLRKDLANVKYDTPVVVSMHCPLLRWKNNDGTAYRFKPEAKSSRELVSILKPYKNVHTFSGHSHRQCLVRMPEEEQNLMDHNISGACGAWWRTRATGLKNLCPDGTPAGYEVMSVNGPDLKWQHKAFEYDPEKQFFVWDMNGVKDYFANNREMKAFRKNYPKWTDYSDVPDNYVYVNLWAWDPKGKLTITENGKELPVEIVTEENPLYVASYMVRNTIWLNQVENKGYQHPRKFQLFRAKASTADAPIVVSWTDCFGKETKETLKRPAAFAPEEL